MVSRVGSGTRTSADRRASVSQIKCQTTRSRQCKCQQRQRQDGSRLLGGALASSRVCDVSGLGVAVVENSDAALVAP